MNPTPKRADQLQFLRFLAFCLIFIHHMEFAPFGFATNYGSGLAVSFFFMLSGFVSAYSRYGKEEPLRWYSPFQYLWRKYIKVLPLHLLTLGIAVLFSNIPAAYTAQNAEWLEPQLYSLVKNVFLIHAWFPNTYFDFNGVSWFLSSIMFAYLFTLPVSALLNKLSRKKLSWLFFTLLLAVPVGLMVGHCYATRELDLTFLQYIHPASRLLEYIVGMVLCHLTLSIREHIKDGRLTKLLFTLLEILALGVWIAYLYIPGKTEWLFFTVHWLIPNGLLLVAFGFGFGWITSVFRLAPLKRLGDVSFECFLIHQLVIRMYLLFNSQIVVPGVREKWLCTILCFAITIGMALMINKKPKKAL